jgi:hypothetical protein
MRALREQALHARFDGQVAVDGDGAPAELFDVGDSPQRVVARRRVVDRDVPAVGRERERDLPPDAACGARDEGGAVPRFATCGHGGGSVPAPPVGPRYHRTMVHMPPIPARLPLPGPVAADHSARLQRSIAEAIRAAGGWIPFDRYMELALYAPGLGYYSAGARKFGDAATGGDFVTAPEISPLFASALAAQVAQVFVHTPARIVEFGAGSGVLARDLLDALAARGVAVERYAIVELSPELAERQRALLDGRGVEWLAAPPRGFDGVMLANEVLDVMPVRLFVMRGRAPRERGVGLQGDELAFAERDADTGLREAVDAIERRSANCPTATAPRSVSPDRRGCDRPPTGSRAACCSPSTTVSRGASTTTRSA